jgi:hypothetical protein
LIATAFLEAEIDRLIAFKRAGDLNVGEFSDAVVLKKFGDVPDDLSELPACCGRVSRPPDNTR